MKANLIYAASLVALLVPGVAGAESDHHPSTQTENWTAAPICHNGDILPQIKLSAGIKQTGAVPTSLCTKYGKGDMDGLIIYFEGRIFFNTADPSASKDPDVYKCVFGAGIRKYPGQFMYVRQKSRRDCSSSHPVNSYVPVE